MEISKNNGVELDPYFVHFHLTLSSSFRLLPVMSCRLHTLMLYISCGKAYSMNSKFISDIPVKVSPTEQLSCQALCCMTLIPVNKCYTSQISNWWWYGYHQSPTWWIKKMDRLIGVWMRGYLQRQKWLQSVCIKEANLSINDSSQKWVYCIAWR